MDRFEPQERPSGEWIVMDWLENAPARHRGRELIGLDRKEAYSMSNFLNFLRRELQWNPSARRTNRLKGHTRVEPAQSRR